MFGVKLLGLNLPSWFTFAFFGGLTFFGVPKFMACYAKVKTYAKTKYQFYSDRI
jgi:hypothetical protein